MNALKKSPWLKAVKISGVLVVVPPLIGLVPITIHMIRTFQSISESGASPPAMASEDISFAVQATSAGFVVSFIAGIALVVSVIGFIVERRRARLAASPTA